jgi:hypothetical protein
MSKVKLKKLIERMVRTEMRNLNENESPNSRGGGWNENFFVDIGLMDILNKTARLEYEIKNTIRGKYALRGGTIQDMVNYLNGISEEFTYVTEQLEDYMNSSLESPKQMFFDLYDDPNHDFDAELLDDILERKGLGLGNLEEAWDQADEETRENMILFVQGEIDNF